MQVCVALTGQHATAQHIAHALDVHGGTKAQGPGGTRSLLQVISQLPPSPSVHDVANPPSPLGQCLRGVLAQLGDEVVLIIRSPTPCVAC